MSKSLGFHVGMRVMHRLTRKQFTVTAVAPRGGPVDVEDDFGQRDCYDQADLAAVEIERKESQMPKNTDNGYESVSDAAVAEQPKRGRKPRVTQEPLIDTQHPKDKALIAAAEIERLLAAMEEEREAFHVHAQRLRRANGSPLSVDDAAIVNVAGGDWIVPKPIYDEIERLREFEYRYEQLRARGDVFINCWDGRGGIWAGQRPGGPHALIFIGPMAEDMARACRGPQEPTEARP